MLELEAGKGELNDTGLKSEQNACRNRGWCDRARTHKTKAGISESSIDSEMNDRCSSHKY